MSDDAPDDAPATTYANGDVTASAVERDGAEPLFVVGDPNGDVELSEEQLRWLCFVAGPALLPRGKSPAELLDERHPRPA